MKYAGSDIGLPLRSPARGELRYSEPCARAQHSTGTKQPQIENKLLVPYWLRAQLLPCRELPPLGVGLAL